jgi:hypothetical protein
MIAQRRGRVSFCSAGRTRSPGEDHCSTLSAQDHSSFNRSVLLLSSPSFSSFQFQYFKSFAWHGAGGPGAWWGCSEHSASGQGGSGWPSLPPPGIGRGAGRQRLHIFSGRQKLRMLQSLAAGVPWVQLACWPAAWISSTNMDGGILRAGHSIRGTGTSHLNNLSWGVQSAACRGRLMRRGLQV